MAKEKDEDTNPVQEEELAKTCHLTLGQAWPRAAVTQGKPGHALQLHALSLAMHCSYTR